MKTKIMLLALALSASTGLLTAQDTNSPADGQQPPAAEGGHHGQRGGFHLLPPGAAQRLDLTDDQQQQLAALEAETKAKLEKILTPEQMQKLNRMHPPRPQGGMGGPRGGGPDAGGPGPDGGQGGPGSGQGGPDGGGAGGQQPPPGN